MKTPEEILNEFAEQEGYKDWYNLTEENDPNSICEYTLKVIERLSKPTTEEIKEEKLIKIRELIGRIARRSEYKPDLNLIKKLAIEVDTIIKSIEPPKPKEGMCAESFVDKRYPQMLVQLGGAIYIQIIEMMEQYAQSKVRNETEPKEGISSASQAIFDNLEINQLLNEDDNWSIWDLAFHHAVKWYRRTESKPKDEMSAEEYFKQRFGVLYEHWDKFEKSVQHFDYHDMLDFAEQYAAQLHSQSNHAEGGQSKGDYRKEKIIDILKANEQTFVYTDSYGNTHPFQGIHRYNYERIAKMCIESLTSEPEQEGAGTDHPPEMIHFMTHRKDEQGESPFCQWCGCVKRTQSNIIQPLCTCPQPTTEESKCTCPKCGGFDFEGFYKEDEPTTEECISCKGTGSIISFQNSIRCNSCNGSGIQPTTEENNTVAETKEKIIEIIKDWSIKTYGRKVLNCEYIKPATEILSLTSQPTEPTIQDWDDVCGTEEYYNESADIERTAEEDKKYDFGLTTVEPHTELRNQMAQKFAILLNKGFDMRNGASVWTFIHEVVDCLKPTTEESKTHVYLISAGKDITECAWYVDTIEGKDLYSLSPNDAMQFEQEIDAQMMVKRLDTERIKHTVEEHIFEDYT